VKRKKEGGGERERVKENNEGKDLTGSGPNKTGFVEETKGKEVGERKEEGDLHNREEK